MLEGSVKGWLVGDDPDLLSDGMEILSEPAKAFVESWSSDLADIMHLSTNTQIEHILVNGIEKHLSVDQVAKNISDSGIRDPGYKARRAAITEVLRAESYGQLEAMRQNPAIIEKVWEHTGAYKNNIAGYGIEVKYKDDDQEETPEAEAEWTALEDIVNMLTLEQDTKELFEDAIEARERYGIAYIEVIRDNSGNVTQLEFVKETPTITMSRQLDPLMPCVYYYKERQIIRKKRFRKFKQTIGGTTIYFKEFGDPRVMDLRSGKYSTSVPKQFRANELFVLSLGTDNYGKVRWVGQILGSDGARRAEHLNNNYFINGRHTPLAIAVKNGTLTDSSYKKLQDYMNGIRGASGQHSFLLLEVESFDNGFDGKPAEVEFKDLASILQKDELFQEYIENNRQRVQSAFNLPDLYVGYTRDFNRATAQTAMEVTEKQVFQPERASLAWAINNRLLNGYNLKYCEVYLRLQKSPTRMTYTRS